VCLICTLVVRPCTEVTSEKLAEAFKAYGAVQNVALKQQKGKDSFAFIDFDSNAAVLAAIAAEVRDSRMISMG
jgi:RNA recognition motif. (a.k.a. RRM, RBD, or RNP domain)